MKVTEKITVNLNVVDLGKIDLLIEQGFYSNRTDCIKTAVRSLLSEQSDEITLDQSYHIGITHFSKSYLENVSMKNEMLDVKVIGLLKISDDVSLELAIKTIQSLHVMGVFNASPEIKEHFRKKN